jgi:hypothetical protein
LSTLFREDLNSSGSTLQVASWKGDRLGTWDDTGGIATEWQEFAEMDLAALRRETRGDLRIVLGRAPTVPAAKERH